MYASISQVMSTSSGSRVRRLGTIAMSSNPYARRPVLPIPISTSTLHALRSAPETGIAGHRGSATSPRTARRRRAVRTAAVRQRTEHQMRQKPGEDARRRAPDRLTRASRRSRSAGRARERCRAPPRRCSRAPGGTWRRRAAPRARCRKPVRPPARRGAASGRPSSSPTKGASVNRARTVKRWSSSATISTPVGRRDRSPRAPPAAPRPRGRRRPMSSSLPPGERDLALVGRHRVGPLGQDARGPRRPPRRGRRAPPPAGCPGGPARAGPRRREPGARPPGRRPGSRRRSAGSARPGGGTPGPEPRRARDALRTASNVTGSVVPGPVVLGLVQRSAA